MEVHARLGIIESVGKRLYRIREAIGTGGGMWKVGMVKVVRSEDVCGDVRPCSTLHLEAVYSTTIADPYAERAAAAAVDATSYFLPSLGGANPPMELSPRRTSRSRRLTQPCCDYRSRARLGSLS